MGRAAWRERGWARCGARAVEERVRDRAELVVPSPNVQAQEVGVLVDVSVKVTARGAVPLVVFVLKLATGGITAAPTVMLTSFENGLSLPVLSTAVTAK